MLLEGLAAVCVNLIAATLLFAMIAISPAAVNPVPAPTAIPVDDDPFSPGASINEVSVSYTHLTLPTKSSV